MQSTPYDLLNPALLARIRAQTGAPVLPDADRAATVDGAGAGVALHPQPGLAPEYVYGACIQLHAQITAAGYDASCSVVEGDNFSYEINWFIPPVGTSNYGRVLASIGRHATGWSLNVDVYIGEEISDNITLEAVALDDATLLRWLGTWLDVGLTLHAFFAKAIEPLTAEEIAAAEAAGPLVAAQPEAADVDALGPLNG